jgi:hypothetical protein
MIINSSHRKLIVVSYPLYLQKYLKIPIINADITFCTSEARRAIDDYLQWQKLGEKLTADSPVFRRSFNKKDVLQIRNIVKSLSRHGIAYIIRSTAIAAGIRRVEPLTETNTRGRRRSETMAVHGLRKFFDTTCEMTGVDTLFVEVLMGRKIGLKKSYFKPTDAEILPVQIIISPGSYLHTFCDLVLFALTLFGCLRIAKPLSCLR